MSEFGMFGMKPATRVFSKLHELLVVRCVKFSVGANTPLSHFIPVKPRRLAQLEENLPRLFGRKQRQGYSKSSESPGSVTVRWAGYLEGVISRALDSETLRPVPVRLSLQDFCIGNGYHSMYPQAADSAAWRGRLYRVCKPGGMAASPMVRELCER
jgi:hypothetical protein